MYYLGCMYLSSWLLMVFWRSFEISLVWSNWLSIGTEFNMEPYLCIWVGDHINDWFCVIVRLIGVKGGLTIGRWVSSETLPVLMFLSVCKGSLKVFIRLRNILILTVVLASSKNDSIMSYFRSCFISSCSLDNWPPKSAVFILRGDAISGKLLDVCGIL